MRPLACLPLLLAACFSGESTRGLPCTRDASCGDGLACVAGVCGGEPTQTFLSGLSILFVVTDDPGSGALQARLAEAADPFLKILVEADIDLRVGVISTAMAHPHCGEGLDGGLQLTSCRDRLEDFKNDDLGLDVQADACELRCAEGLAGDAAVPSPTAADAGPTRARPWIQDGPLYGQNLYYKDLAPNRMIGCFLARGITGCPFEQPLAALVRALERMRDPMDDNYGFVDERSLLVVIFVGRGPECSYADDAAAIFDPALPADDRVFWPDDASEPTPAICWNAGAECTNLVDNHYFECHPVDHAIGGAPTSHPDDAVLIPISTTAETVAAAVADMGAYVTIAGVLGVPMDYAGGELHYTPTLPGSSDEFGIGAGCEGADVTAAPPLRLAAFADALDPGGLPFFPACAPKLGTPLQLLAKELVMRVSMPLPE